MLPATWRRVLMKKLFIATVSLLVGFYIVLFQLPKLHGHKRSPIRSDFFKRPRFALEQNGDYWIYHDFMRSKISELRGNMSITLTTHGTYRDFKHMEWLLMRWSAPISMAVYVHKNDYEETLKYLYHIKYCTIFSLTWTRWVSVQLVFFSKDMPPMLHRMSSERPRDLRCLRTKPQASNFNSTMAKEQQLSDYPLHLLRNVARLNAETYFVLPLDPDMLPTRHFAENFLQFVHLYTPRKPFKSVYCIPTFPQVCNDVQLPTVKSELRVQIQPYINGSLKLNNTDFKQLYLMRSWLSGPRRDGDIGVFEVTAKPDKCTAYVSINIFEPLYDQRYAESYFDTNSSRLQVLAGLGFDFVIMDGTFISRRQPSWQSKYSADLLHSAPLPAKRQHILDLIKLNAFASGNPYFEQ